MTPRREDLVVLLRRRILTGLRAGTVGRGDRLPSTRQLSTQLDVDPRVALAAYRALADEGLVELRPRSGIYVAARAGSLGLLGMPAEGWLIELLAEGVAREVPATELPEWLRRSVETLRLRALVVARTVDQIEGVAGELRADYGLETVGLDLDQIADGERPLPELRRADLVVTTEGVEGLVRPVAERHGKPVVIAAVRPDLVGEEWRRLLEQPVYVLCVDARFAELVRTYFSAVVEPDRVRTLLVGQDDIGVIPPDAPVYVTRSARDRLGDTPVPGRPVPTARIFSPESSRALLTLIVHANLRAVAARELDPGL